MLPLILVSFVWAFSFGLIKDKLSGLDSTAVATVRIAFSALVFLPFLRRRHLHFATTVRLAAIGALQFGLMYVLYLRAYHYLQAFEVALFTIFTPLYLTLLEALFTHRLSRNHFGAAVLSVGGAGIVLWQSLSTPNLLIGFTLIQISNLCFAGGQLAYRRVKAQIPSALDAEVFALLYVGAVLLTLIVSLTSTNWSAFRPSQIQWFTMAYLGLFASGLCFFWWNVGATRVNAGTLAAFNNLKVPLGIACSLFFFGGHPDVLRLVAGLGLIAAGVVLAEREVARA
jgi:drug/metabolite transporter (DMT)-like permease